MVCGDCRVSALIWAHWSPCEIQLCCGCGWHFQLADLHSCGDHLVVLGRLLIGKFTEKCEITSSYSLNVVDFLLKDKITTGKRKHEDDVPVFEQIENTSDPARCPVKMFECYLSKRWVWYRVVQTGSRNELFRCNMKCAQAKGMDWDLLKNI